MTEIPMPEFTAAFKALCPSIRSFIIKKRLMDVCVLCDDGEVSWFSCLYEPYQPILDELSLC